jgi:hypothetical protein
MLPRPAVHPDLAPLAAFPSSNQNGAAGSVQIAFGEGERFADAQTGPPEYDDQPAQPQAVGIIARAAHHGDDLLHGRWVRRIAQPLIARRAALVKAGQRRRRPATASGIKQG